MVPVSSFKTPQTIASYRLVMVCSFNWAAMEAWARSFLQAMIAPVVSISIR